MDSASGFPAPNQPVNGNGPEFAQPVDVYDQLTALNVAADGTPGAFQERTKDGDVTRYDLFGSTYYPTLLTDRNGNTLAYTRDASGNLQKLTDVHGRYLSFSYDAQGRMTQIADSAGRSVAYAYNSAGDRIAETDPDGDVTQYAYDANHRITQVTYPNGGHHTVNYDGQGRVADESDDGGNNSKAYSYYASSTAVTDALGRVTVYGWIQNSGLRKINRITDPNGGVTSFAYDGNLNLTSQTDPLGRTTKFQYDAAGNVTAATDANGQTTQTAYEPNFNQPTGVIDPKANKTSMSYDAKGNLTQTQDALGNLAQMSYDAQGHVTASKDPLSNVTAFAYDNNGALTSVTDPLGRATGMTRDALSRLTKLIDAKGNATRFSFDGVGDITTVQDAQSHQTAYSYQQGRSGRLLNSITDANGHATSFNRDIMGRINTIIYPLNNTATISYDKKGNVASFTTPNGQSITLARDNFGREVQVTSPEGNATFSYDATGNLLTESNYNGAGIANQFEQNNRLIQQIQTLPNGYSVTIGYTYDANGNRTTMTTPWGNFHYTYDSLDHLTSVTNPFNQTVTYQYDALGRPISIMYPNGIQTLFGYDPSGRITQVIHERRRDNTAVAFQNYSYDAAGDITQIQDSVGIHQFSYDSLNRLISAVHPPAAALAIPSESFTYDPTGNRLGDSQWSGYVYDAANRMLSNSSFTYTYDGNGNRLRSVDLTGDTTSYSFDSQNLLTQVNSTIGGISAYKYDARRRRAERTTSASHTTYRYIYNGSDVLAILDSSNNLLSLFTNGFQTDEHLISHESDGTDVFLHSDAMGSIIAETDSTGALARTIQYSAYGEPVFLEASGGITSSDAINRVPFAYIGREYDAETGLYYFRDRYYDPFIGQFISPDRLATHPQALLSAQVVVRLTTRLPAPYAYAELNPISNSDASGLQTGRMLPWAPPSPGFPQPPSTVPLPHSMSIPTPPACPLYRNGPPLFPPLPGPNPPEYPLYCTLIDQSPPVKPVSCTYDCLGKEFEQPAISLDGDSICPQRIFAPSPPPPNTPGGPGEN